jgi:very-short-patch-repair endonuclease
LELRYLREVERPHGLPVGNRQRSRLGLPYCTDVGYDEYRLLVELDGRDGHEGVGRFRDMRRDNRFAAGGLTTFRYGFFALVDHPCAVAGQVWAILAERGRPEPFRHCPRCLNTPLAELIRG